MQIVSLFLMVAAGYRSVVNPTLLIKAQLLYLRLQEREFGTFAASHAGKDEFGL